MLVTTVIFFMESVTLFFNDFNSKTLHFCAMHPKLLNNIPIFVKIWKYLSIPKRAAVTINLLILCINLLY